MLNIPICTLKSAKCTLPVICLNRCNLGKNNFDNNAIAENSSQKRNEVTGNMLQTLNKRSSREKKYKRIKPFESGEEDMELDRKKVNIKRIKPFESEEEDMEEKSENESIKGEELSPYEKMILKNREEKLLFLQSLKIDEAKAGFVEAVSVIKKKPKVQKIIPKPKTSLPPTSMVLRKSARLAKFNGDLSEEALFSKALTEARVEKEIVKKVLPPVLPFEKALQFKELYQDFMDDFEFQDTSAMKSSPTVYNKDVFKKMLIDGSRIAKVVPARITAMALHPTCEKTIVCAGSKYGQIGIWNVDSSSSPYVCGVHYEGITNLQFNPDNVNQFMSSSYDGTLRCGDFEAKVYDEVYNISEEAFCTYFDFLSSVTFLVAQGNGKVALVDNRSKRKRSEKQHTCHDYSVKTVNVHPVNKNYFATADRKGTVRLWDLRKLQTNPFAEIDHHKRSINSAYFSPVTGNSILTTSMDDSICIFDSSLMSEKIKLKKSLRHNNYTGRWLSVFRATWIPNTDDVFVVGSMLNPRRIEIFNDEGNSVYNIMDDFLTTITSVNVFHPFQPVLAAANSSGKVCVFKELAS